MDVERSQRWKIEHRLRNDLAVRGDREEVGSRFGQSQRRVAQPLRGVGFNAELERRAFHGRRREPLTASRGPVRLGHDERAVELGRERAQRRNREFARAEENDRAAFRVQTETASASDSSSAAFSSSVTAGRTFCALSM